MGTELGIRFRRRVSVNEPGRRQERLPFSVDANKANALITSLSDPLQQVS